MAAANRGMQLGRRIAPPRFLLFVDGQQRCDADDWIDLRPGSDVCFVRLVALAGG